MHLKLVHGHLPWNIPLSELLFSCMGHLGSFHLGAAVNILMHSFDRYVYTVLLGTHLGLGWQYVNILPK